VTSLPAHPVPALALRLKPHPQGLNRAEQLSITLLILSDDNNDIETCYPLSVGHSFTLMIKLKNLNE
jgi:hypothetical protein